MKPIYENVKFHTDMGCNKEVLISRLQGDSYSRSEAEDAINQLLFDGKLTSEGEWITVTEFRKY